MTSTGTSNNFFLRVGWLLERVPNGFIMKRDMKYSHGNLFMTANAWTCILMVFFLLKVLML